MSLTSRKNLSVKAIQSKMASEKKYNDTIRYEWEMACNTNVNRGNVYKQEYILTHYSREEGYNERAGASKVCHLKNEYGNDFEYIVIKRMLEYGWVLDEYEINREHEKCTGNQLIDEINCWLEYQEKEEGDLLCPILKYFTSKSDQVKATSETMCNNVVIISQKAIYVNNASMCCAKAEALNNQHGLKGEDFITRMKKLEALSKARGWRDAIHNSGNSGVIFDYSKNCYKAVFIDYAL